jgi:hypothetical protein
MASRNVIIWNNGSTVSYDETTATLPYDEVVEQCWDSIIPNEHARMFEESLQHLRLIVAITDNKGKTLRIFEPSPLSDCSTGCKVYLFDQVSNTWLLAIVKGIIKRSENHS